VRKNVVVIILIILGISGFFVINKNSKYKEINKTQPVLGNSGLNTVSNAPQSIAPADKIEVIHFHGTQQCWSCITVGEYALKTIKEKFPNEYESGKIVYMDINGESVENKDIVMKYKARGPSLFLNAIRGEKDNIEEDVTVWRLVGNEKQFSNYFENKLKTLLGK